ncbi:MAG TPA: S8 family serine peptidase, partial [Blastocatellia bacterium]|nr:S8 family serine peptidase [Blastocatellia bacterium]
MKLRYTVLVFIIALSVAAPGPARSQSTDPGTPQFRKGEVIVEIKSGASIDAINARKGTTTIQQLYGTNFYRLRTPKGKKENKFRKRLSKDPDVLSAALNPVVNSITLFGRILSGFPDGFASPGRTLTDYNSQQSLSDMLRLSEVRVRSRGAGVVVAIIDTGISRSHTELASRLWRDERGAADLPGDGVDNDQDGLIDDALGWDFVDNDNDPSEAPENPSTTVAGHGTFIAGIVSMIAPDARILPVRAFPSSGMGDAFSVASAIKYAADHGAHVINLSLGSPTTDELLLSAISYARQRGVIVVAAAGNENSESPRFPASLADVLAVAAIDNTGRKAQFSNFGAHVDVVAPGVKIISTFPGNGTDDFAEWSGTSFAAPFAAAEAALILEAAPGHPNVRQAIESSATSIDNLNPGHAARLGKGRIDPLKALECISTNCDSTPLRDLYSEIYLTRGPGIASGACEAEIEISGTKQEFEVEASGLSVRSSYRVMVDGVEVARTTTNSLGYFKLEFSNEPGHLPLAGPLNPVTNIKHVELRDSEDRIVLQGDFGQAGSVGSSPLEKETRLVSTGAQPGVAGRARIEIEPEREELRVEADDLAQGITYQVVVDGVNLGTITPHDDYFRIEFTSDGSSGRTLPPSLRPAFNIKRVEIQDLSGLVILQGDFQPGGGNIGSGGSGGSGDDGGGGSGGGQDVNKEAEFSRTGVDTDAEGRVRVRMSG